MFPFSPRWGENNGSARSSPGRRQSTGLSHWNVQVLVFHKNTASGKSRRLYSGRGTRTCLHFLPDGEKIKDRPGQARAGDSPLDCHIGMFKSLLSMRIQPPAGAGGCILANHNKKDFFGFLVTRLELSPTMSCVFGFGCDCERQLLF